MGKYNAGVEQLQKDLKKLGFDPGTIDGLMGPRTRAAMKAFGKKEGLDPTNPGFYSRVHEEAIEDELDVPKSFEDDTDDGDDDITPASPARGEEVGTVSPVIHKVKGKLSNRKSEPRDFTKQQDCQVHITDYWPGENCVNMKTNLYVSTKAVYEVHPIEACIVKNYATLYHIEIAGVNDDRRVVKVGDKTYVREVMVWDEHREDLLEEAMVYTVESFRARGIEICFITHKQTFKHRMTDPRETIAQAVYRICKKHGFKLNFKKTRGSGTSAECWVPAGEPAVLN